MEVIENDSEEVTDAATYNTTDEGGTAETTDETTDRL